MTPRPALPRPPWSRYAVPVSAFGGAWLLTTFATAPLHWLLAGGAAHGAGLLLGSPVERVATGWLLPHIQPQALLINASCAGFDFFQLCATLLGWRLATLYPARIGLVGWSLLVAAPYTLVVNALRIAFVAHAHALAGPFIPAHLDGAVHLAAGIAVFLPALVFVSLIFEYYAKPLRPAPASA